MKRLILISLIIFGQITSSCQKEKKDNSLKNEDSVKNETIQQQDERVEKTDTDLKEEIIKLVVKHYESEINKQKTEGEEISIDSDKDGTTISISYPESVTGDFYEIKRDKIFIGDLNKDSNPDAVVSVGRSFGASGNTNDIFLFIKNEDNYNLIKVYDQVELSNCEKDENGQRGGFDLTEIKDNRLYGESFCYDTEDADCCPSKKYNLEYEFTSDLRLIKKTKK